MKRLGNVAIVWKPQIKAGLAAVEHKRGWDSGIVSGMPACCCLGRAESTPVAGSDVVPSCHSKLHKNVTSI